MLYFMCYIVFTSSHMQYQELMANKFPYQLQVRIDKTTLQHIRSITKHHQRGKSEIVRMLIKREACRPTDPASLLADCGGQVLADMAPTGEK